ncbi:GntR family transcriptional regulator [Cryobacterium sp. Y50]|uniref:GntR family transcriptional regulator n=1 Tax=Cryobacterium sp. Y50 TaxID=2048286 RepID=UPI000CE3DD7F|nr:GntR family transcriptional regulator [Cryobacterium sp. Y50]
MSRRPDLNGISITRVLSDRRITADYIADAIRDAINSGSLGDGAVLNQADLATYFGVSRVPVREAMRQLQAESLIDSRAHQQAVVRGLDIDRLVEVYTLRSVLEGWLIEQAIPNITSQQIEKARELNAELEIEQSHARWLEINAAFHRELYEPSGALITLELLDQLRARAERYARMWSQGTGIHRPAETCQEHNTILDLVESGAVAEAKDAIQEHVLHTRDRVVHYGVSLGLKNLELA